MAILLFSTVLPWLIEWWKTAKNHPKRARRLCILCDGLQHQYEGTYETDTFEIGLKVAKEAVSKAPAGHPDRAFSLRQCASCLHARHMRITYDIQDINKGLDLANEVLRITDETYPDLGIHLFELGGLLE